ncbi:S9 family peptidase [Acidicapsa dinghuensis]|uniref:Acyl-peptide hydrolase n=1 Tax=Acidicapsa dinghuensis TaxID=2218256 RepID=A0ABW1EKP6_9BACT|nr:prolyl oligopeptidase family serine peptidase [Acidicapsa dinghuensis]
MEISQLLNRRLQSFLALTSLVVCFVLTARAQSGFTLQQVLSAPFPTELQAASALGRVSWLSNAEGRRNLFIAEPDHGKFTVRQLTHYTEDNGVDLGDVAWSADAQQIAYVRGGDFEAVSKPAANPAELPGGIQQAIWLVSLKGSKPSEPVKIAYGHSPVFTHDGKQLIYVLDNQLWTIDLTSGTKAAKQEESKPTQLLHTRGSLSTLRLSPDGTHLAFVSDRGDHSFVGVYDLATKSLVYLDPSSDSDRSPSWSPDSHQLAFIRTTTAHNELDFAPDRSTTTPWSIHIADIATGQPRVLWTASAEQGSVFHELATEDQLFWTSGNQIVFPSEADGWLHLYAVPAAGGSASLLTPGDFEVEHAAFSQNRAIVVYSSNQQDIDRRHLWKLSVSSSNVYKPEALTVGEGVEVFPALASDGTVFMLRSDARLPMRVAAVRGDASSSGTPEDLDPAAIPKDFPASQLVVPQQVIFSAADGMQIHGQLFLPPASATQKHAALVFFHGGSRRQMLLGWHYMLYYNNAYGMNQYLASQGYVVLSINYRSGIGYGLNFREALNYGTAGASEFNDVMGAGLYLPSRSDVDPNRIGCWGGSYGGYLTALALGRASDLFRVGVDFHGVHDWNIELGNWNTSYDPTANPNLARLAYESSPVASVSTWRSPVLFIHGDDDRNVQFEQTPKLIALLREQHVPLEELIFPDEIHDFLLHKDWLHAYAAETSFFARYLKP